MKASVRIGHLPVGNTRLCRRDCSSAPHVDCLHEAIPVIEDTWSTGDAPIALESFHGLRDRSNSEYFRFLLTLIFLL